MPSYTEPVSRLLTVGRPLAKREWRTYRELGIGPEHIPELLAMMTDLDLHFGGDSKEKWAPVHAWRALAGLHVTEAIDPFLTLLPRLREAGEAKRITENAPEFFATIGPAALPTLLACLNDQDQSLFALDHGRVDHADGPDAFPGARRRGGGADCESLRRPSATTWSSTPGSSPA